MDHRPQRRLLRVRVAEPQVERAADGRLLPERAADEAQQLLLQLRAAVGRRCAARRRAARGAMGGSLRGGVEQQHEAVHGGEAHRLLAVEHRLP